MTPTPLSPGNPVILDGKELDEEMVEIQRAVRRARARGAKALLTLLVVGFVAVFFLGFWISSNATGEAGLSFFLLMAALLFIFVYFGNNYWQWRVLQAFDMRCPHCDQPLGGDIHWTKRPGYACPHCGKDAIATARQLGDM